MKNLLRLFIGLAIISVITVSCKKDNAKKSTLKIGTTDYELSTGHIKNYGGQSVYNLDLRLYTNNINFQAETGGYMTYAGSGQLIYFELYTSLSTELDARVYNYNSSSQASGAFDKAYYYEDYSYILNSGNTNGTKVYITSGSITVAKNGSEYEIDINCIDENGKAITGYFKGEIPVYDYVNKSASEGKGK